MDLSSNIFTMKVGTTRTEQIANVGRASDLNGNGRSTPSEKQIRKSAKVLPTETSEEHDVGLAERIVPFASEPLDTFRSIDEVFVVIRTKEERGRQLAALRHGQQF
jgi:hypothetical protein